MCAHVPDRISDIKATVLSGSRDNMHSAVTVHYAAHLTYSKRKGSLLERLAHKTRKCISGGREKQGNRTNLLHLTSFEEAKVTSIASTSAIGFLHIHARWKRCVARSHANTLPASFAKLSSPL